MILATLLAGFSLDSALAQTPAAYEPLVQEQSRTAGRYKLSASLERALPSPGSQLALPVPDGGDIVGTVDRLEDGYEGVRVVIGHIGDEAELRRFFLAIGPDGLAGSIESPRGLYTVAGERSDFEVSNVAAQGLHRVSPGAGENDGSDPRLPDQALRQVADIAATTGDATIDFAAIGNQDFWIASSATGGVNARISLFAAKANQAFRDSGIRITLRMNHYDTWVPGSNAITNVAALDLITPELSSDPAAATYFRNKHNSTQADIVVYFRKYQVSHANCGRAHIGGYRATAGEPLKDLAGFRERGYAVVSAGADGNSFCSDYTFAHEIGHVLGSMHDHIQDPGPQRGAFDESFGQYVEAGTRIVTTIMGYAPPKNFYEAPIYSSPLLTKPCLGVPCGVEAGAGAADNARRMNDVRFKVASWRGGKYIVLHAAATGTGEGSLVVQGSNCGAVCDIGWRDGTDLVISAVPAADSTFSGWSGACTGTGACAFTLSETKREVFANFTSTVPKFRLTVTRSGPGSGKVTGPDIACGATCIARYEPNRRIALQAVGDPGQEFMSWGGACEGQPATCTLLMSEAKTTVARFKGRRVTMISTRNNTAYAIRSDLSLWAWGNNDAGQFGVGTKGSAYAPVLVGMDFQYIEAGPNCAYGIKRDGTLWAWGNNAGGKLGDGTETERLRPVKIGDGFQMVSSGLEHAIAMQRDGSVWSWGRNLYGQLGTGNQQVSLRPIRIAGGYTMVSASGLNSAGVTRTGALMSWGANVTGEVGDGTTINRLAPHQIGSGFTKVSRGFNRAFAFKSDGSAWVWGANPDGQAGTGNIAYQIRQPVRMGEGFEEIAPDGPYSTVARKNKSLWVWGRNLNGVTLGDPNLPEYQLSPANIGGTFIMVAASLSSTFLAVREDGSLWAWGANTFGEIGDGSLDPQPRPKLIWPAD